jgi:hypothetical protein
MRDVKKIAAKDTTKRPERTSMLKLLNMQIASLSNFYWMVLAGFHSARTHREPAASRTRDFLPERIAAHIDYAAAEFDMKIGDQEPRLHYLCLADAVTLYEDYLRTALGSFLKLEPLPLDKKPKLQISLREANESSASVIDFISACYVSHRIEEMMKANYRERISQIDNLLDFKASDKKHYNLNDQALVSACELRNCIVHCCGIADKRTVDNTKNIFPEIEEGVPVHLDDKRLFMLIEALQHHAQGVDLAIRTKYPSLCESQ